jgi:hypothetical protein
VDELKLYDQFQELSFNFPKISLQKEKSGPWLIRGEFNFSSEYSGRRIDDSYFLEMLATEDYPDVLPKVHEVGERIPRDFHHYQDGSLCLGTPLAIRMNFKKEPTLTGFVYKCVIPYLYSFSYKSKFGKMPYDELSHGGKGILEYYKELFEISDTRRVLRLIGILTEEKHSGKTRCPCGSGKRLRACHGIILSKIKNLQSPTEFRKDFNMIIASF